MPQQLEEPNKGELDRDLTLRPVSDEVHQKDRTDNNDVPDKDVNPVVIPEIEEVIIDQLHDQMHDEGRKIEDDTPILIHEPCGVVSYRSKQVMDQANENKPQDFFQDLGDEYRVIHSEDETDDTSVCQLEKMEGMINDVFDPVDQEVFLTEVHQLAYQQGLSPRGSLSKSKNRTKHNVSNVNGHTTRPITRSYLQKIRK